MDERMEEVLAFWQTLMADDTQKPGDRLKASENLARYLSQETAADQPGEDRELRIFVDYGAAPCS